MGLTAPGRGDRSARPISVQVCCVARRQAADRSSKPSASAAGGVTGGPKGVAGASGQREPEFAHPSEAQFGALLTYYGISWLYEPTTFPLSWDAEGHITQAFAPDFYLPDYDLYIELATRKQAQMTAKNRKIRRLRQLYPDVRIKLVNRRTFADLLLKFGLQDRADQLIGDVKAQSGHV